jgi:ATP-dependent DNA ligase
MLQRSGSAVAGFIEPCLPSPAKAPPSGTDWLHEIKHDGFRLLALRDASGVRLYSGNGHDFSKRFPLIVTAIAVHCSHTLWWPFLALRRSRSG